MFKIVFDDFASESKFHSWVERQADAIRQLAYEKRRFINKRELEREIDNFLSIKKAWVPTSRLHETNKDVNIVISIDKEGYHSMYFIFPITREMLDKAKAHREEVIDSLNTSYGGSDGHLCYSLDESIYDLYKDAVQVLFPFADRSLDESFKAYEMARKNPLLRKSHINFIK